MIVCDLSTVSGEVLACSNSKPKLHVLLEHHDSKRVTWDPARFNSKSRQSVLFCKMVFELPDTICAPCASYAGSLGVFADEGVE